MTLGGDFEDGLVPRPTMVDRDEIPAGAPVGAEDRQGTIPAGVGGRGWGCRRRWSGASKREPAGDHARQARVPGSSGERLQGLQTSDRSSLWPEDRRTVGTAEPKYGLEPSACPRIVESIRAEETEPFGHGPGLRDAFVVEVPGRRTRRVFGHTPARLLVRVDPWMPWFRHATVRQTPPPFSRNEPCPGGALWRGAFCLDRLRKCPILVHAGQLRESPDVGSNHRPTKNEKRSHHPKIMTFGYLRQERAVSVQRLSKLFSRFLVLARPLPLSTDVRRG